MDKQLAKTIQLVGDLKASVEAIENASLQKELMHGTEVLLKSLFRYCQRTSVEKLENTQKAKVVVHQRIHQRVKTKKENIPSLADPKARELTKRNRK